MYDCPLLPLAERGMNAVRSQRVMKLISVYRHGDHGAALFPSLCKSSLATSPLNKRRTRDMLTYQSGTSGEKETDGSVASRIRRRLIC